MPVHNDMSGSSITSDERETGQPASRQGPVWWKLGSAEPDEEFLHRSAHGYFGDITRVAVRRLAITYSYALAGHRRHQPDCKLPRNRTPATTFERLRVAASRTPPALQRPRRPSRSATPELVALRTGVVQPCAGGDRRSRARPSAAAARAAGRGAAASLLTPAAPAPPRTFTRSGWTANQRTKVPQQNITNIVLPPSPPTATGRPMLVAVIGAVALRASRHHSRRHPARAGRSRSWRSPTSSRWWRGSGGALTISAAFVLTSSGADVSTESLPRGSDVASA